jgi:hypothetical protein
MTGIDFLGLIISLSCGSIFFYFFYAYEHPLFGGEGEASVFVYVRG